jgi:hypothetical protein
MSATSFLESSLTKHMIYLQRHAASVNNEERALFESLAASMRSTLNNELTDFSAARLRVTIAQLNALIDTSFDVYNSDVKKAINDLAEYESTFQYNALQSVMTPTLAELSVNRLEALLSNETMTLVSGKTEKVLTINQLLEDFKDSTKAKSAQLIRSTIEEGLAAGDSVDTVSRRVAKAVGNTVGLPSGTIQTWSKTNVLTMFNHVSQQARNAVVQANTKYLEFEKWSSVLDGHTSLLCAGRDGRKYKVGEGDYPPAHRRCRSLRQPWIPDKYAIIKTSERASMNGPVNANTKYGGFLKDQSKEFQDDYLGVERAKLFRSGKVSIDKFTDAEGRTLTLAELMDKEGITLG